VGILIVADACDEFSERLRNASHRHFPFAVFDQMGHGLGGACITMNAPVKALKV
jgi:hypothetical protein